MLAEHGALIGRRTFSPWKKIPLRAARRFFPFGFGWQALTLRGAEARCLVPRDVERGPAREGLVGDGMHRDHVPNQFLQFIRRMLLSLLQEGEIFAEADFILVYLICVQPDPLLRKFGIVELGPKPVGIVVNPLAAESKPAGWNRDGGSRLRERGDGNEVSGQLR